MKIICKICKKAKDKIIKNHCYTELVYDRINKKLNSDFSKTEIEVFLKRILEETTSENYNKIGKNFYIENTKHNIRITVNSSTFRIITVDKI